MFLTIAIVFTLLQLALAFFLVIISIHGPDSLPGITLFWFITIQLILWSGFAALRKYNDKKTLVYLTGLGLITTATGPLMVFIADKYDACKHEDILAHTKIRDVRDELLLTENGRPFGVIFSFKAEFPRSEHIYITPLLRHPVDLYGRKPDPNDMRVLDFRTDPLLTRPWYFKQGINYDISFTMVPHYLLRRPGGNPTNKDAEVLEFCLQYPVENVQYLTRDMFEAIITTDNPDHYQVMIHGTAYGTARSENGPAHTHKRYNPVEFYNTYKSMNIAECGNR